MTSPDDLSPSSGDGEPAVPAPAAADSPSYYSVYFFVAATFAFSSTVIFFPDADPWLRYGAMALGILLVVLGAVRLGREVGFRRGAKGDPPVRRS
jgi:hypothetical protein